MSAVPPALPDRQLHRHTKFHCVRCGAVSVTSPEVFSSWDQAALLVVLDAMRATGADDRIRTAARRRSTRRWPTPSSPLWSATAPGSAVRSGQPTRRVAIPDVDYDGGYPEAAGGSFFPSLLGRRLRVDQALFAVVMDAHLHGVSTRKVDDLVKALRADTGISKSEVSWICADLDQEGRRIPGPSLAEVACPYVFLDAT
jgi:putative transposase